jgi:hypothetical protein
MKSSCSCLTSQTWSVVTPNFVTVIMVNIELKILQPEHVICETS